MTNGKTTPARKGERLEDAKNVQDLLVRFELACIREKLKFEPQRGAANAIRGANQQVMRSMLAVAPSEWRHEIAMYQRDVADLGFPPAQATDPFSGGDIQLCEITAGASNEDLMFYEDLEGELTRCPIPEGCPHLGMVYIIAADILEIDITKKKTNTLAKLRAACLNEHKESISDWAIRVKGIIRGIAKENRGSKAPREEIKELITAHLYEAKTKTQESKFMVKCIANSAYTIKTTREILTRLIQEDKHLYKHVSGPSARNITSTPKANGKSINAIEEVIDSEVEDTPTPASATPSTNQAQGFNMKQMAQMTQMIAAMMQPQGRRQKTRKATEGNDGKIKICSNCGKKGHYCNQCPEKCGRCKGDHRWNQKVDGKYVCPANPQVCGQEYKHKKHGIIMMCQSLHPFCTQECNGHELICPPCEDK